MQPDLQPQEVQPNNRSCTETRLISEVSKLPVKRHRGEPGHTRDTRDTEVTGTVQYLCVSDCPFPLQLSTTEQGQDTRANRTRHTTRSSTQPHAKQQLTNATQTNLTFTHAHTHTSRTENDANQQTTPPRITATLTHPPPRASALASGTIACARCPTDSSATASARCLPCRCTCRSRPTSSSWRRVRPAHVPSGDGVSVSVRSHTDTPSHSHNHITPRRIPSDAQIPIE